MIAGLTGGIGSGKSTVAKLFELMGCAVFNSDHAAKRAYFEPGVKDSVTKILGKRSYSTETEIDKTYISEKVFGDPEMLKALNAIIHPVVGAMFRKFTDEHAGRVVIKESALLFEAKITEGLDKIIVVAAEDELRIQRVMERDRLTRHQVIKKINSQIAQEEKVRQADFVISNNRQDLLIPQAELIFKALSRA